MSFVSECIF